LISSNQNPSARRKIGVPHVLINGKADPAIHNMNLIEKQNSRNITIGLIVQQTCTKLQNKPLYTKETLNK